MISVDLIIAIMILIYGLYLNRFILAVKNDKNEDDMINYN